MNGRLIDLISLNKNKLLKLEIFIDEIKTSELDFKEKAEQVDLVNNKTFARIILFESNRLYIQILNIENEKTIYFFDDNFDNKDNLEKFVMEAIYKMIN